MSVVQQERIAEKLLAFIRNCPDLPVSAGDLSVDKLQVGGRKMSISFPPGQVLRISVNGRKRIRQPFSLAYGATRSDNDVDKTAMMSRLNILGRWFDSIDSRSLELGEGIVAVNLAQTTWAFILEQSPGNMTYTADFSLDYDQRTKTAAK